MNMNKEKPIAKFFDGERQVEVLPPDPPSSKDFGEASGQESPMKHEPADKRTAEFKIKPRVKNISGKDLRLSAEDKEQFHSQGRIPFEHIQSYLDPNLKESVELFRISKTDTPLIAFLNTNEDKIDLLNNYISTAGPFTYSELALRFSTNKEMNKLSALSQEIQNRQLDADDLLFYCPKDELENLGLKPPMKKQIQL